MTCFILTWDFLSALPTLRAFTITLMREDINLKCLKSRISPCTFLTHPVLPGSPDACQRALLVFAHANLLYSGRSGFVQDHTANKTWDSSMELSDCVAQALNPSLLMRDHKVVTFVFYSGLPAYATGHFGAQCDSHYVRHLQCPGFFPFI